MVVPCEGIAGGPDGELPGNGGAFGVTVGDPGKDFTLELLLIREAAVETRLRAKNSISIMFSQLAPLGMKCMVKRSARDTVMLVKL